MSKQQKERVMEQKTKISIDDLLGMQLHEVMHDIESHLHITRVVGGWIYNYTFVTSESNYDGFENHIFVPEPKMKQRQYIERILKFQNDAIQLRKEVLDHKEELKLQITGLLDAVKNAHISDDDSKGLFELIDKLYLNV